MRIITDDPLWRPLTGAAERRTTTTTTSSTSHLSFVTQSKLKKIEFTFEPCMAISDVTVGAFIAFHWAEITAFRSELLPDIYTFIAGLVKI